MAFERFDKSAAVAVNKEPSVMVAPNGVISLTWRAFEMLGKPNSVVFLYDHEESVIGILGCSDDDPDAYVVRRPRPTPSDPDPKGTVSIRGTALFKFYEIPINKKLKSTPYMQDNMLCFALDKPTQVSPETKVETFTTYEEPPF